MNTNRVEKITQITERLADALCSCGPALSDERVQEIANIFEETAALYRAMGVEDALASIRAALDISEQAGQ